MCCTTTLESSSGEIRRTPESRKGNPMSLTVLNVGHGQILRIPRKISLNVGHFVDRIRTGIFWRMSSPTLNIGGQGQLRKILTTLNNGMTTMFEIVIDHDKGGAECTDLLYLLFIFESNVGLLNG